MLCMGINLYSYSDIFAISTFFIPLLLKYIDRSREKFWEASLIRDTHSAHTYHSMQWQSNWSSQSGFGLTIILVPCNFLLFITIYNKDCELNKM